MNHISGSRGGIAGVYQRNDWAAEQTNFAREVAEQALSHTVGSATERSYARTSLFDKRRKLMEQWSKYATTPPVTKSATVTTIHGRRK